MVSDTEGTKRELYDLTVDPNADHDVAATNQPVVEQLWQVLVDEAGGTLPEFKDHIGVVGG